MAQIPFVDTHIHFSDLREEDLAYVWLEPEFAHPVLGDIGAIQAQRYWADDFVRETRFSNVSKSVHVQAALGIADPVDETKWLQAFADRLGHPHGIVGEVHLAQPDAAEVIERHMAYANFRGVRDFGEGDYPLDDDLACRVRPPREARPGGLSRFRARTPTRRSSRSPQPSPTSSSHSTTPASRASATTSTSPCGSVSSTNLAEAPNVVIKISGLGMCDNDWTVESIRPWVMTCIEIFGVERSFFGTNWPVDRLYSSYPDVVVGLRRDHQGLQPRRAGRARSPAMPSASSGSSRRRASPRS